MHTAPIASPVRAQKMPETAPAWFADDVLALYELPFMDLIHRAQSVHREHFHRPMPFNCPVYCPSRRADARKIAHIALNLPTTIRACRPKMIDLEVVLDAARQAQAAGAQLFFMATPPWCSPRPHQLDAVAEMIKGVKALGMETCVTLGMLKTGQAEQLKCAGLNYYNHNLDTSAAYYTEIISSRQYQDHLDTC